MSRLTCIGFEFNFHGLVVDLLKNKKNIDSRILVYNLFKFVLDPIYEFSLLTMHDNKICIKYGIINEYSSRLWHRKLRYISTKRIKKLVDDGVLKALGFIDIGTCVNCIKGKQTNKTTKGAKRNIELLEIIHINMYGLFSTPCLN